MQRRQRQKIIKNIGERTYRRVWLCRENEREDTLIESGASNEFHNIFMENKKREDGFQKTLFYKERPDVIMAREK